MVWRPRRKARSSTARFKRTGSRRRSTRRFRRRRKGRGRSRVAPESQPAWHPHAARSLAAHFQGSYWIFPFGASGNYNPPGAAAVTGGNAMFAVNGEFAVADTPLPPSLELFISALAGIGFIGRKRRGA
jgi:hypothetical protein